MIFYFTGTGNSLYAARQLAAENEKLINIKDMPDDGPTSYYVKDGESVGFVFPVYFYTLSDVMAEFIHRISLKNAGYVYAVITCGGGIGGTGGVLKRELAKRGITLHAVFPLLMPDNAMLYYNISTKEQAADILKKSDIEIRRIKTLIQDQRKTEIKGNVLSTVMRAVYHRAKSTRKFYVTDACIGCGLCEKNCPEQAIKIVKNRPRWVKKSCSKCTACINRCPKQAIQYTKKTEKRNRYVNPYV